MTLFPKWLRIIVATGLLSIAALCAWSPTPVLAEGDPLASGRTELVLRSGLARSLRQNGVKIRATDLARLSGRVLKVPVAGGELDPTTGQGVVLHQGGIAFRHRGRAVSFDNLSLDTATRVVTAEVAGKGMVFALARGVSFVRDGLGTSITIDRLRLTGSAAKRLNTKLRLKGLFRGRQLLGAGSTASQPASVKLVPVPGPHDVTYSFGFLFFIPDTAALAKFEAKDVFYPHPGCLPACLPSTFGPIGGGAGPGFSMIFYITGGRMAVDGSTGTLTTVGRVGIHTRDPSNPSQVSINGIWLDLTSRTASAEVELQPQPQEPGELGRVRIGGLDGSASVEGPAGAAASLTGFVRPSANGSGNVVLGAAEAAILNHMFPGPPAADFVAGDVFGKFSFHAGIR